MSYRFTDTDKWGDGWFTLLKPYDKLLFLYLCDNCDIAGFIEINTKRWAVDLGLTNQQILGAIKGLGRGLIYSDSEDCVYIKNFLKHQKNIPLNNKNNAHLGIIKRFDKYSEKFSITDISEFILGASRGLASPIGIGNGSDNGSSIIPPVKKSLEERQEEFKIEVETFLYKYDIKLLTAFYAYWSEPDLQNKKMRKEMQKTWDTRRRLVTWNNNSKFTSNGKSTGSFKGVNKYWPDRSG